LYAPKAENHDNGQGNVPF